MTEEASLPSFWVLALMQNIVEPTSEGRSYCSPLLWSSSYLSKIEVKSPNRIICLCRMRVLVLLLLAGAASAKIFSQCELAKKLKNIGMASYKGVSLGGWVCLARWESSYNTQATNLNTDGSTNYGIFQINSRWWCNDGGRTANRCKMNCTSLLKDDISDAIACAKRAVRRSRDIGAWVAWREHCKGQDVSQYTQGCGV
ncbi:hypothetical protein GJAV_G00089820 [Gymnothorax javanicus]|nr:hypothetical protein GJAV_G00089820 [Gymnothorax javanicus]